MHIINAKREILSVTPGKKEQPIDEIEIIE